MQTHNLELVKIAFAEYLSLPEWNWTLVVTQTFDEHKTPCHRNMSSDSFKDLMEYAGNEAVCIYGFAFGEQHKSGRPHWHAILHMTENLFEQPRRADIWRYMFDKYGRNRIEPYRPNACTVVNDGRQAERVGEGIARYLCKYVAKESARDQAWWDFTGFMSGQQVPARRIRELTGIKKMEYSGLTPEKGVPPWVS